MLRDGISLVVVMSAAALPFAVQQRLEHGAGSAEPSAAGALIVDPAPLPPPVPVILPKGAGHRVQRSADGMFYLTAHINGRPVRFLIDTGASMVVLSSRDARATGLAKGEIDYHGSVRTVNGEARVAPVSIDRIRIAGRNLDNVDAAIVEDGIGVSLLGQNALGRLSSMSIEGDQLTLR